MNSNLSGLKTKIGNIQSVSFLTALVNPHNQNPAAVKSLTEVFHGKSVNYTNTFVYVYNADEDSNHAQIEKITVRQNGQILVYFNEAFDANMRMNFIGFLFA